jgi:hypothetical protein
MDPLTKKETYACMHACMRTTKIQNKNKMITHICVKDMEIVLANYRCMIWERYKLNDRIHTNLPLKESNRFCHRRPNAMQSNQADSSDHLHEHIEA